MGDSIPVLQINDTKAGMSGLDKDRINAIIHEASKGSKFYEAKLRSQVRIVGQIKQMSESLRKLSEKEIAESNQKTESFIEELEKNRNLSQTLVHVDMDAFYAAVEILDRPDLKDVPMAVGSNSMISTSNYVARKFGVRAGMPGFIGRKLCPTLVLIPPSFEKYMRLSNQIRKIFSEYDPNFLPVSLDEAYLNITHLLESASAENIVSEMRNKIFQSTGLTASAGIASNTLLAKICSDQNKPNGQFTLFPNRHDILTFIQNLPIRKISGIGNVTEQLLSSIGIQTVRDLQEKKGVIRLLFSGWKNYIEISLGIGSIFLDTDRERKSLSNEMTFIATSETKTLHKIMSDLVQNLDTNNGGKTITLKIKTHDFQIKTRSSTFPTIINDQKFIYKTAISALNWFQEHSNEKPLKLRLMGVRLSNLSESHERDSSTIRNYYTTQKSEKTCCPICFHQVYFDSDADSKHIDDCLSQIEIKKYINEQDNKRFRKRKYKNIDSYFTKL